MGMLCDNGSVVSSQADDTGKLQNNHDSFTSLDDLLNVPIEGNFDSKYEIFEDVIGEVIFFPIYLEGVFLRGQDLQNERLKCSS